MEVTVRLEELRKEAEALPDCDHRITREDAQGEYCALCGQALAPRR